jgi:peptidoglycan/xylan/chitin deacetylase (PgdA/CDA1 family)
MKIVQCWDDAVTADIRLIEILRKHHAKATFNVNPGLHGATRGGGWEYKGSPVQRMALDELRPTYEGFTVANHTMTHPRLQEIELEKARLEIVEGRDWLQQHFQQEVLGFAYPFGTYNDEVMELLREAGHVYGRTTKNVTPCFPPEDAMAFHADCHFLNAEFDTKYEAAKACGVFYFWGHSYEIIHEEMWNAFDQQIAKISADPDAEWAEVWEIF